MTTAVKIKAGATFSLPILAMLPAGTWSAACDIRRGDGTLVGALTATLAPLDTPDADGNTHAGLLEATSEQTDAWEPGTWRSDVAFTDTSAPSVVVYTESFAVLVEKAITHA